MPVPSMMNLPLLILLVAVQNLDAPEDAISMQEQQIKALQQNPGSDGVYSRQLAEGYLNYSALLRRAERPGEAIEALQSALHLEKVNSGPYALIDSAILRELMMLQARHGRWQDAEGNTDYLLWLYKRHNRQLDASIAQLLDSMASLYMDAGLDNDDFDLLERAHKLYVVSLKYHESRPLTADDRPWRSLLAVNHHMQRLYNSKIRTSTKLSINGEQAGSINNTNQPQTYQDDEDMYWRALKHLRTYRAMARKSGDEQLESNADILIGDWHLLNEQQSRARVSYLRAWRNMDEDARLKLATPRLLPPGNDPSAVQVPLRLRVGRKGRVKTIKSAAPECANDGETAAEQSCRQSRSRYLRARAIVRKSYFRPAIVDGRIVDSPEIVATIPLYGES